MVAKKTRVVQSAKTGSYTVHVPKDPRTGAFTAAPRTGGRIVMPHPTEVRPADPNKQT